MGLLTLLHYWDLTDAIFTYAVHAPIKYYLYVLAVLVLVKVLTILTNLIFRLMETYDSVQQALRRVNTPTQHVQIKTDSKPNGVRKFSTRCRPVSGMSQTYIKTPSPFGVVGLRFKSDQRRSQHGKFTMLSNFVLKFGSYIGSEGKPIYRANAMATVKGWLPYINPALAVMVIVGMHTTSSRVRAIVSLLRHFYCIFKHQGVKGVVIHLKTSAVLLQQAIGNFKIYDPAKVGCRVSRTNKGIPRSINRVHRASLLQDPKLIRLYLTIFNLFRVLHFEGVVKTKSITNPSTATEALNPQLLAFIPLFFKRMAKVIGINADSLGNLLQDEYNSFRMSPILKSSPQTGVTQQEIDGETREGNFSISTHPLLTVKSGNLLFNDDEVSKSAFYFVKLIPRNHPVQEIVRRITLITVEGNPKEPWLNNLGKLSVKEEAAGKMRIFALVDPWTQWLLKPLHDLIFNNILRAIPQDGTFDQLAPLRLLMKRTGGKTGYFSLDLTAATDRLPLALQQRIIAHLANDEFSLAWATLLTGRDYWLKTMQPHISGPYRYSVGQPMGALSSWASLALTHHFIVQFAAFRVGELGWYQNYAVLGDDVVIADLKVARSYLQIMKSLGVECGLHKSIMSYNGIALEFAKKTFYKGVDVSPIPFKELAASFFNVAALVEFSKKYSLTWVQLAKALGFKYKVLGGLNKPLNALNGKLRMIYLALHIPVTQEEINLFFQLGATKGFKAFSQIAEVMESMVSREFTLLKRKINAVLYDSYSLERLHVFAKDVSNDIIRRNRLAGSSTFDIPYILPLVKAVMLETQGHSLSAIHEIAFQINAHLIHIMLHKSDMEFAALYESYMAILKMMGTLPLDKMKFDRVLDEGLKGLTDTTHIRMWRRFSKYLQGTKVVPNSNFGIRNDLAYGMGREIPPHLGPKPSNI